MYELALHFNPHCAEACNNLGVIYKDRDNLDKAVECYQVGFDYLIEIKSSQSLNRLVLMEVLVDFDNSVY
jgi:protein O-GlcNAc transferase